jgi:hypothetical protein
MGVSYNVSPIVTNGLVLYLDVVNPRSYSSTSNTWTDLSNNGNNGTINGTTVYNTGGLLFDGSTSYINFSADPTVNLANAISYEIVFTPTVLPQSFPCLISKGQNPDPGAGANAFTLLTINSANVLIFQVASTVYNPGPGQQCPTPLTPNTTYHVTATYDSSLGISLYVNGVLTNTFPQTGQIFNSNQTGGFGVGRDTRYNVGTRMFKGNIYSVKIYNRALAPNEVIQNFNALRGRYGV